MRQSSVCSFRLGVVFSVVFGCADKGADPLAESDPNNECEECPVCAVCEVCEECELPTYDGPVGTWTGDFVSVLFRAGVGGDTCTGTVTVTIEESGQITGNHSCTFTSSGYQDLFCSGAPCVANLTGQFTAAQDNQLLKYLAAGFDADGASVWTGYLNDDELRGDALTTLDMGGGSLFTSSYLFSVETN